VSVLLAVSITSGLVGFLIGMETHRRISEPSIAALKAYIAALKAYIAALKASVGAAHANSHNIIEAWRRFERSETKMWAPTRGKREEKPS